MNLRELLHRLALACAGALAFSLTAGPAAAQTSLCEGATCEDLQQPICDAGGFSVQLTDYQAAAPSNSGTAVYTYQICSPPAGVCQGGLGLRAGESCLENDFCQRKGSTDDPEASCSRMCAVESFRGLSHFDVDFPSVGTCVGETTLIGGTCQCTPGSSGNCDVDSTIVKGDGSCPNDGTVAKCDNTTLEPGDCIEMKLEIAGELTGLGLGRAIVVSKEATDCNETCIAGPSCDDECGGDPTEDGQCLTRTIGFWGTHPWITNSFDPVTVCGDALGCSGASDGKSDPTCTAGSCDSIMEGLGSVGGESPKNSAYIAMVKQLTAAKLNLNASRELLSSNACADFRYQDKSIDQWIADCELLCGGTQAQISGSGCTEALDAFNNSQDTGFAQTPAPFDQPQIDDFGNVSGADPSGFTAAHGNSTPPGKWVIGKKIGNNDCSQ